MAMILIDQPKRSHTNRPKILVVDDEIGPRESVAFALGLHFEVRVATNGMEALAIVETDEFSVIVLDVRMPGLSGFEVLARVREKDQHVGVVMLTGFGTLESAQMAMEAGANQYLRKPPRLSELLNAVKGEAERAKRRRQEERAHWQMREMLERLNNEVKEASDQIWQGRASVELVHDIANPLTVMIGFSSLLREELEGALESKPEVAELCEYASIIESAAQYCHHLAENWRQASRSSGEFCDVDLGALAVEIKKVIFFDDAGIEIEEIEGAVVRGSRYELTRVLQNLLRNAKEAGATKLRVTFEPGEKCLHLKVADNGRGMDAGVLAQSVKGGFSTKENGTGVGLSICRHIAAIHGAQLSIESEPGRGTEVKIRFPL